MRRNRARGRGGVPRSPVQFNIRFDARPGTGYGSPLPKRPGKRCCYLECRRFWREKGMARKLNRTPSNLPLGLPVPSWSPRQLPPLTAMSGQFCRVEPIDSTRHGEALFAAYAADREGRLWTYLPWGPYSGAEELCAQIDAVRASGARPEYALIDLASGKPFGQASYLNIDPAAGSIKLAGSFTRRHFSVGLPRPRRCT